MRSVDRSGKAKKSQAVVASVFGLCFTLVQKMSEYWKSLPRHFCDFCKCWIADNKPSRDFHERGKRHLENVQQKLDDLRKKGVRDAEKKEAMEESLRIMEEAALKSFKEDLRNNPALAAQYKVKDKTKEQKPEKTTSCDNKPETSPVTTATGTCDNKTSKKGTWHEAQSAEGFTYYWNDSTDETTWDKPKDYVQSTPDPSTATQETTHVVHKTKPVNIPEVLSEKNKDAPNAASSKQASCLSLAEAKKEKSHAYGGWEPVQAEASLELQLPQEDFVKEEPKYVPKEKAKLRFVEKTVESVAAPTEGAVSFKKRKMNSGATRSIKRREQD